MAIQLSSLFLGNNELLMVIIISRLGNKQTVAKSALAR